MNFKEQNGETYEKKKGKAKHCVLFGTGVIFTLGIYGFLQEKVMTTPYGSEMFKGSVFLVLCNRLFAVVTSTVWLFGRGDSMESTAPFWKYLVVSFTNVAATICQYQALHWVSFPMLMLGKSFKMLPVMLWMTMLSQKKYEKKDYLVAIAVTIGVCTFVTTGDISSPMNRDSSVYGLLLLVGFCVFDSFTSSFQEKLFREHNTATSNQMLYINLGSSMLAFAACFATGEFSESLNFSLAHPPFVVDVSMLSAAAVAAQVFIFADIKELGALCLAATMNVRQVLSIILSCVYYSHPISFAQVLGLCITFIALFWKVGNELNKVPNTPRLKTEESKLKDEAA